MNYRMLGYLLGIIMMIEAALLALPAAVALVCREPIIPFLITMGILLALAAPLVHRKPKDRRIYPKEGFVCVASAWLVMSVLGALPFVFSGAIPSYIDALFETASGFTTTGATVLTEIESLPRGILFWRSFTHWIGGMGVLVFMLAIMPSEGGQSMYLLRAEVAGPTKDKLVPKMRQSAMILYGIYVSLTVLETVLLLCTGMPLFDAVTNAFSTAGTGGFSVKNTSIAAYANPAAEWIIAIFMLLFGVNFNIYFLLLLRRFGKALKNEELRVYLLITLGVTAVITLNTVKSAESVGNAVRAAFFQVTSIFSTTGFATVDYEVWPMLSQSLLWLLLLFGACAGSTTGGLKLSRVLILIKNSFRELKHLLHPRSVNVVRIDGEAIPESTLRSVTSYLAIYLSLLTASTVLLSIGETPLLTNLTATMTCLNNVGPGFELIGPSESFAFFSPLAKLWLTLVMIVGRLEIMPMLILLSPSVWRRRR